MRCAFLFFYIGSMVSQLCLHFKNKCKTVVYTGGSCADFFFFYPPSPSHHVEKLSDAYQSRLHPQLWTLYNLYSKLCPYCCHGCTNITPDCIITHY